MTPLQLRYLKKLQAEWDYNNDNYTEVGFKEYAVSEMEDDLIPEELDEVMSALELNRSPDHYMWIGR